ncbi:MAG TPA: prepilin-type N-terminal cleavage/methylation domain-containing protein [Sulfurimonas autotrophica]|nr:prepilin-type N-terminal cleavage/methylation domain-containing protein [Sulfurimonas autotrophica]
MHSRHKAFTLIEVMVAVVIVSVVIGTLLKLQGDASTKLLWLKKSLKESEYITFLFTNEQKYGFLKEHTTAYKLLGDFDIDRDIARVLKQERIAISYQKEERFTMPNGSIFEIGTTKLDLKKSQLMIERIRLQ